LIAEMHAARFVNLRMNKRYEEADIGSSVEYRLIYQSIDDINHVSTSVLKSCDISKDYIRAFFLQKVRKESL